MTEVLRSCKFCGASLSEKYRFVICVDCRRATVEQFKHKHGDMKRKPSHVKILEAFGALAHNPAKNWEIRGGLSDESFQGGMRKLVGDGLVRHLRRGYYELTEEGRLKLNVGTR